MACWRHGSDPPTVACCRGAAQEGAKGRAAISQTYPKRVDHLRCGGAHSHVHLVPTGPDRHFSAGTGHPISGVACTRTHAPKTHTSCSTGSLQMGHTGDEIGDLSFRNQNLPRTASSTNPVTIPFPHPIVGAAPSIPPGHRDDAVHTDAHPGMSRDS